MGSIIIKNLNGYVGNTNNVLFVSNTDNDPNSALTGAWTNLISATSGRGVQIIFIQTLNINPTYSNYTTSIAYVLI